SKSDSSVTFRFLRFGNERGVSQSPLFAQQVGINRKSGQRIGTGEAEVVMHAADHPKNAALLHAIQSLPEILLRERIVEPKLGLHLADRREKSEPGLRGAKGVSGERIDGELHAFAIDQLFAEFFFGRFLLVSRAQIERALAPSFEINDPELRKNETGLCS